jgi:hypothetical protein
MRRGKGYRVQDTPRARLTNCGNPFNPEFNTQNGTVSQLESMTQASCIRHGAWKGGPALVTPSQTTHAAGLVDVEVEVNRSPLVPHSAVISVPGILT